MEIEIWLQKKDHTMTKQTSESGKAKKISRDEELDCYFGPGLSISFPPSTLMNVSSVLPPRFNYSPRTLRPPPQHSTERAQQAVKTVLESLERCPIFFFFSGRTLLPIIAHQSAFALNAIIHLSANSWPRRTHYHSSRSSIWQKRLSRTKRDVSVCKETARLLLLIVVI